MKKLIMGFILGVVLSLTINAFAGNVFEQPAEPTPTPTVIMVTPEPVPTPTPTIIYEKELTDLETVVKDTKDSCVMIYAYLPDGSTSQGSGWVYKGYVITAKHVVAGAEKIDIFTDDEPYGVSGTVYYSDLKLDVAIIRTDTGKPSVTLGDSDKLTEGQKLVAITSPKGVMNVIDECINSGISDELLMISEGNLIAGASGGAVFDYNSNIIAMMQYSNEGGSYAGSAGSYAIPINDIKQILNDKLK